MKKSVQENVVTFVGRVYDGDIYIYDGGYRTKLLIDKGCICIPWNCNRGGLLVFVRVVEFVQSLID